MKQELARRLKNLEAKYTAELKLDRISRIAWATPSRPRGLWRCKASEGIQNSDSEVAQKSSEICDLLTLDGAVIDDGTSASE